MNKETLSLFNVIQVEKKSKRKDLLLEKTIKHGFILDPSVAKIADDELLETISNVIGISGEKANQTFHKSWRIIKDTPQEELMMQQIIHYMTTYGFETLGIYRDEAIYIPNEELDIPEVKDDIRLIVIKGLNKTEILEKILDLGAGGIALKEETIKDIMTIVEYNKYNSDFLYQIFNKELKAKLNEFYNIIPKDPVEYLRFVINKITEESLLIKNNYLIEKIKASNTKLHVRTLDKLLEEAPKDLAKIFYRYRKLFLALKTVSTNKTFFNTLRKQAIHKHQPLPEDFLNAITSKIKRKEKISTVTLKKELEKVSIFRKIRLAYALKFRTKENDSIIYKVRNGKGYVTDFEFNKQKEAEKILKIVLKSIENDLDVKGKTLIIPNNVNYALPSTEKQFTGNLPTGSYTIVPKDMIIGIHWENTKNIVDLDLSLISETGKTGWDSDYSSEGKKVLFSGDITSAPKPKGATELFYIKEGDTEPKIMYVNYYNFQKGDEVDCKIVVAQDNPSSFNKHYMLDPNKIITSATINIKKKQYILGLIMRVNDENRFYFTGMTMGNGITARCNEQATKTREYLVNSLTQTIDFKEILTNAGAKIVGSTDELEDDELYVDLSPEALDKTTIINLLIK